MKTLGVLLFVLLVPIDAWAGQIHIQPVTLGEIARHGFAVLGTVVSVHVSTQMVKVKVKNIWQRLSGGAVVYLQNSPVVGETQEFKIYTGVVWNDARKSPVDRRVPGALHLTNVKVGQEVVLVTNHSYEMLPVTQDTLKKLDLFFSKQALAQYQKQAPVDTLYADLTDADLWEPALDAMCVRGLLEPRAFLGLPPYELYRLGWQLGQKLQAKQFDVWLRTMVAATQDGPRRLRLYDLAGESSFTAKVSVETRIALINTLDLAEREQQTRFIWFLRNEVDAIKATPDHSRAESTLDRALKLETVRIENADWKDDEMLRDLIALLPTHQQIVAIKRIGQLITTSKNANKSKKHFDERMFELFLGLVKRVPSGDYLPELASLDLSVYSKTSQGRVESRVALLDAGLAVAKGDPSIAGAVYKALERWIRDEAVFTPEIVMSIDGENPEAKQQRWTATLKQFKALKP